jgi:hypothetical protein
MAEGFRAPGLQAKLDALESRKAALEGELGLRPPGWTVGALDERNFLPNQICTPP